MADTIDEFWQIEQGIADPARFFAMVPALFPNATTFVAEGTEIEPEVARCYARFAEAGPAPARQTIWPRSDVFRCFAVPALFEELTTLSGRYAPSQLLHHLSLHEHDRPLLLWHDAFANRLLLAPEITEAAVASLATPFGCTYRRLPSREPVSASIELVAYDSKSALEERLRRSPRSLMIGADAESPRNFYLLTPTPDEIRVGLCAMNFGPAPKAISFGDVWIVGHDVSLTVINTAAWRVVAKHRLGGAFYEFVPVTEQEILAIHELGALKENADGAVCWTFSAPEIVERFRVEDGRVLTLEVMDYAPLRISLEDGRTL